MCKVNIFLPKREVSYFIIIQNTKNGRISINISLAAYKHAVKYYVV